MKLPAPVKIGLSTAFATWAAPKINAMVTTTQDVIVIGEDAAIPDAPNMIVPLTGVLSALAYTVLSMVFGGEAATVKGGGGAT